MQPRPGSITSPDPFLPPPLEKLLLRHSRSSLRSQGNIKGFLKTLLFFFKGQVQLNQKLAGRHGLTASKENLQTSTRPHLHQSLCLGRGAQMSSHRQLAIASITKKERNQKERKKTTNYKIFFKDLF